jgi:hypothetical protein
MRSLARVLLAFTASALAACGGFTSEGDGSHTLEVDARVSFEEGTATMNARVSVTQRGAQVEGATVTLRDDDTEAVFPLENDGNFYRSNIAGGYRRKLELTVARGDDKVSAKLEGPGQHFIVKPFDGTRVELGDDPLKINWSVSDGIRADDVAVTIDGTDYRGESNKDRGEVEIPRELLRPGDAVVRIERSNSVKLDGALGASTFVLSYQALSHVTFED